ncbi:MAG: GNAT family N-acetyltransferase [Candidatus Dormibacteria bacterium]
MLPQVTSRFRAHPEGIEELIASDHAELLVGKDDAGAIVGMAAVSWYPTVGGRLARLESVVTAEGSRRSGVGLAMVSLAEQVAVANGAIVIELSTGAARGAAQSFYKDTGYEGHPAVAFSKALPRLP